MQIEIQIVDTHETLETPVVIGSQAFDYQINRTLLVEDMDTKVNQLAVMLLAVGGPTALAPFQETSRFERMAQELEYAIRHTSGADLTALLGHLASDSGSALVRRVSGLWDLVEGVLLGTARELDGAVRAYADDRLATHLGMRLGIAAAATSDAISNGTKNFSSLLSELKADPASTAPKLLVLVLSSVAASGGGGW